MNTVRSDNILQFMHYSVVCNSCNIHGPVVQRSISPNPGLNFNSGFFISLSKSLLGKIFTILFRTSNDQIGSKKI